MTGEPLNIVLLMAGQWRWDTLFGPGHPCETPYLDRLTSAGTVFPNAFTPYPLCCPARGSLFTGKWPHQTGLTDNVQPGSYYPHGKLSSRHATYLERLRDDAGYATSYAGKWHLGLGTAAERGVELVAVSDGGVPGQRGESCPGFTLDEGALGPFYGTFSSGQHRDQCAIEAGLNQIERLAGGDRPFCSVVSTWGPHFPHFVPAAYAERYADLGEQLDPHNATVPFEETGKPAMQTRPYWPCQNTRPLTRQDWRRTVQHYWAYCTFLDAQFGRVLALLRRLKISDRTVVAFVADHGEMLGAHGNFDKGPYLYEEAVHIPFIIHAPWARSPADSGSFVNLRDLFPTLLDLAGASGVLRDDELRRSVWRTQCEETYYCYDSYHGRQFKIRGIRTRRYKYNWSPHDVDELYDLVDDPGERVNRAGDPGLASVQQDLHHRLNAWMADEGDYLRCAAHLPAPGDYVDGRSAREQHDPGFWSDAERAWFTRTSVRDAGE
ncbi:MAG: sulfatase-like hydrolase/transferase [Anaerolineae bacterium]|nr:sulfatase-like hydrolase/transferase [Anaerolineae bacterium]